MRSIHRYVYIVEYKCNYVFICACYVRSCNAILCHLMGSTLFWSFWSFVCVHNCMYLNGDVRPPHPHCTHTTKRENNVVFKWRKRLAENEWWTLTRPTKCGTKTPPRQNGDREKVCVFCVQLNLIFKQKCGWQMPQMRIKRGHMMSMCVIRLQSIIACTLVCSG